MVFMGVALPQISSTGVALALSLHALGHLHLEHGSFDTHALAFVGSLTFSILAVTVLAFLEQRRVTWNEARVGAAYVLSAAVSLLLLAKCPTAERGWLNLFKGEIIAISNSDLKLTLGTLAGVLFLLWLFRKEIMLVSYDRELALTLRKVVFAWDLLLYLLIGLAISVAVIGVGPLVTFGFLLLPPLAVRPFVGTMRQFVLAASGLGAVASVAGFVIAYHWDLPVGPTDVVLLGTVCAVSSGGHWLRCRLARN
jgi:ABC-type Mn2+/Zn2+ transport system permease subunit